MCSRGLPARELAERRAACARLLKGRADAWSRCGERREEGSFEVGGRREFIKAAALGAAAWGIAGATPDASAARATGAAPPDAAPGPPDPHPAASRALTRIAFGSCAKEDKEQPIWEAVLAARPDLFVFLGDNVYGDTRDMAELRAKYARLAAQPGFVRLRETTPLVATWDDHDYGENDAGAEFPLKEESRRIFLEFWGEPAGSARWERDGVYAGYVFGPPEQRVQVLLPDLRYNRTPILKLDLGERKYEDWARQLADAGAFVPGPYVRNPAHDATMLGERQWAWLDAELARPAELRILASSLQVLADLPGWEAWINYARDHQRLVETIRRRGANGLVCISGDTHYGELSRLDVNVPYPLWDLTSSGLTEVWPVVPPNANRVGEVLREANFGLIEIDWSRPAPVLDLQVRDGTGAVRLREVVDTAALRT
jgi:alkaline phosphatase D